MTYFGWYRICVLGKKTALGEFFFLTLIKTHFSGNVKFDMLYCTQRTFLYSIRMFRLARGSVLTGDNDVVTGTYYPKNQKTKKRAVHTECKLHTHTQYEHTHPICCVFTGRRQALVNIFPLPPTVSQQEFPLATVTSPADQRSFFPKPTALWTWHMPRTTPYTKLQTHSSICLSIYLSICLSN